MGNNVIGLMQWICLWAD